MSTRDTQRLPCRPESSFSYSYSYPLWANHVGSDKLSKLFTNGKQTVPGRMSRHLSRSRANRRVRCWTIVHNCELSMSLLRSLSLRLAGVQTVPRKDACAGRRRTARACRQLSAQCTRNRNRELPAWPSPRQAHFLRRTRTLSGTSLTRSQDVVFTSALHAR